MKQISERDWKVYRKKMPQWQERYMTKLVNKYLKLLNSDELASDKFWKLEKRINRDKKSKGVIIEMKRSTAYWDIVEMLQKRIIKMDDLDGFSDEMIADIRAILDIMKR